LHLKPTAKNKWKIFCKQRRMVSRSISKLVAQPEPAASTEGKLRQWYFSLLACFLAKPSPVAVVVSGEVAAESVGEAAVVDAAVAGEAAVVDAAVAGEAAVVDAAVVGEAVAVVDAAAPAAADEQDPEEDDLCLSSSSSE
jgi:hypothetical protein